MKKLSTGIFILLFSISPVQADNQAEWIFPDKISENKELIDYGKELVTNTFKYIGPEVKNPQMRFAGNNLSCKNCHLNSGTKQFTSGFVGVSKRYPQFRARENKIGDLAERINGCVERSLNGKRISENSLEIKSIIAYMDWLSSKVPEKTKVKGQGLVDITYPERAASPDKGKIVFQNKCSTCHGINGQGLRNGKKGDANGYIYPPLWGNDSYNTGAGMYRVITSAKFIKANMPFGNPTLTDEESFDVAAYINSQPRAKKDFLDNDYPDLKLKPIDTPYPPFADDFSALQHKYGPFKVMDKSK